MQKRGLLFIFTLLLSTCAFAKDKVQITSPDRNIVYTLILINNVPQYSVAYKGKLLVDFSSLQLELKNGVVFNKDVRMGVPAYSSESSSYELMVGKAKK